VSHPLASAGVAQCRTNPASDWSLADDQDSCH
jgi:hypothetical protein